MGIDTMQLGQDTCYGHFGFWGVGVASCPRSQITIAGAITQAEGFAEPLAELLLTAHARSAG
jgi:hypothetical protein